MTSPPVSPQRACADGSGRVRCLRARCAPAGHLILAASTWLFAAVWPGSVLAQYPIRQVPAAWGPHPPVLPQVGGTLRVPSATGATQAAPSANPIDGTPNAPAATPPHPAVARIVVPEKDGISYGSGTLVDVRGGFGLVVTNWHVVRDAAGPITAEFQDGFKSPAEVVKTDKDWDLAALSVYSPKADPVPVTAVAPQPGEWLTIAGYGSGDWRTASGPCTQYLAPGVEFPHEMVELATEARQGDSGGPIFNQRGELAGVLFGSGPGYTSGSYGGRVLKFLAAVVPGGVPGVDASPAASAVAAATPRPDADIAAQKLGLPPPPQATALHEARPPANALPADADLLAPAPPPSEDRLLVPPPRSDFADRFGPGPGLANEEVDPKAAVRPDRLAAALPPSRMSPLESAPLSGVPAVVHTPLPPRIGTGAAANGAAGVGGVLTDLNQAPTEQLLAVAWRRVGGTTFTDQAKTIFAFIGALSVVVLLWRASSSRERMADDD